MAPAVSVEGLSKRYRIGVAQRSPYRTLRESLIETGAAAWNRVSSIRRSVSDGAAGAEEFWALRDISFYVEPGEVVGIIGRNGAGKSTLLKILSRITEPTSGRAVIRGRVASLLEVGTGFHPELTGRENIYLNGSILGMTKREITRLFDEIVAFAEIEKFLDTPVKRYSSGMYVRLAFAVAAHLEPEILIVDEVLAVGDADFQKKCLGKMREVSRGGRTVLFVSHNLVAVDALCSRAIFLSKGQLAYAGMPRIAIQELVGTVRFNTENSEADLSSCTTRPHKARGLMRKVAIRSHSDSPASTVHVGDGATLIITFDNGATPFTPHLGMVFRTATGVPVCWSNSRLKQADTMSPAPMTRGTIQCELRTLPLIPGVYSIDLFLGDDTSDFDVVPCAIWLEVLPRNLLGSSHIPSGSEAGHVFISPTFSATAH